MGKKQHSKDRMYLTTKEWKEEWGGFKDHTNLPFKRLPFHCCAITFTPFEDPVCTEDGTVFDIINIVPYIQKHKKHPVTGEPLALKDLIKLTFHKNSDGEFSCPVTNKVFTEHTHIVAVKTSGNVYSWDAINELCIKPRSYKDLITDEPFIRKDIIHIQDPLDLKSKTVDQFDHVQKGIQVDETSEEPSSSVRAISEDLSRALNAIAKTSTSSARAEKRAEAARLLDTAKQTATSTKPSQAAAPADKGAPDWRLQAPARNNEMPSFKPGTSTWDTDDYRVQPGKGKGKQGGKGKEAAPSSSGVTPEQWYAPRVKWTESFQTTGAASRSFTSSVETISTKNERKLVRSYLSPTKKGYLRLHTNMGDLNLELHCDLAPRTCENFLALCEMGYYKDTVFHRSIKNFMIQGGDPTGTGMGGESIFGKTFKDELDSRLLHTGRGVLSMANSGPNTNGSQFYILYKSARHLDYKHSVFGRVVGGVETLTAMERVPTDPSDRPLTEIRITGVTIFNDPFKDLREEEERGEREKEGKKAEEEGEAQVGRWLSNPGGTDQLKPVHTGVGKYLAALAPAKESEKPDGSQPPPAKKVKAAQPGFGNFDSW